MDSTPLKPKGLNWFFNKMGQQRLTEGILGRQRIYDHNSVAALSVLCLWPLESQWTDLWKRGDRIIFSWSLNNSWRENGPNTASGRYKVSYKVCFLMDSSKARWFWTTYISHLIPETLSSKSKWTIEHFYQMWKRIASPSQVVLCKSMESWGTVWPGSHNHHNNENYGN